MAYIDRDLLLNDIDESVVFTVRNAETSPELRGARKIIDRIKNAPTADVVEVVRCKDCKNYVTRENAPNFCMKRRTWISETDFCSYGAKMNGGKEE